MNKVIVLHMDVDRQVTISIWQFSRQFVPKRLDYNNPTPSSLHRVLTYIKLKQKAMYKAGGNQT